MDVVSTCLNASFTGVLTWDQAHIRSRWPTRGSQSTDFLSQLSVMASGSSTGIPWVTRTLRSCWSSAVLTSLYFAHP